MSTFTPEKHLEICKARERLRTWRETFQRPAFNDPLLDEPEPTEEAPVYPGPSPIISVTYKVDRVSLSPAFKDIHERIAKVDGKLSKYFEERKKPKSKDYGHMGIE